MIADNDHKTLERKVGEFPAAVAPNSITMQSELIHPLLGRIIGVDATRTTSFLGVPYARLDHKFGEAQAIIGSENGMLDATKPGPLCVQQPSSLDNEHGLIQKSLPYTEATYSETECLNLMLVKPKTQATNLPVFVYVHGGGYVLGGNSWPQYDPTRIVDLSLEKGEPVIGITINYRLGAYGFMTSKRLREAGFKANNGLRDQKMALKWVQSNISGFGGDPTNVTLIGESVGGASVLHHLHSSEPLFQNAISMGGTNVGIQALPIEVADSMEPYILASLETQSDAESDTLEGLLSVSSGDILSKLPPTIPFQPVVDGDIIPSIVTFEQWTKPGAAKIVAGHGWCNRLLIGDCQFDTSIMAQTALAHRIANIGQQFRASIDRSLANAAAAKQQILDFYKISNEVPNRTQLRGILDFGHDIGFYAPVVTIASNWPWKDRAFVYQFNEKNPWPGMWQGEASHVLDIVFLMQNYNDYLGDEQERTAETFGHHVLNFMHGRDPWPPYQESGRGTMVYGNQRRGKTEFVDGSQQQGRRDFLFELARKHTVTLDELAHVWNSFIQGQ